MTIIIFIPAEHFTAGRQGEDVELIVLHWMATTLAGADATFTAGVREASAHYGLENHTRHQYVREQDTAWHAGNWGINLRSIGIEHSAQPGRPASPETVAESIALCTELCHRYGLDERAIHVHSEYTATQCPGTLPVAAIRAGVRANLTNPSPEEDDVTPAQAQALARIDAAVKRLEEVVYLGNEKDGRGTPVPKTVIGRLDTIAKEVVK